MWKLMNTNHGSLAFIKKEIGITMIHLYELAF